MRYRDEQKELLLKQQAIKMIVTEGLEGFGINKLAKAAGVSPGTIYIYYESKDDFLSKLSMEFGSKILESSLKGFHSNMHFDEGLKLQWENRYAYFKKYPVEFQFVEKVRYSAIYENITSSLNEKYGNLLGAWIDSAVKDKELAPMPFEMYWSLAFAPLYQLMKFDGQIHSSQSKFILNRDLLNKTLNRVLKGLKP
jgi:AcrR family transcriptional regulator